MTAPLYNLTDTWNNGATVFTAILMNVTDTAFAAGSRLMDLQFDATSVFRVESDGNVVIDQKTGAVASKPLSVKYQGTEVFSVGFSGEAIAKNKISFNDVGGILNWAGQTSLVADAAGILAQRNGVNAQASRLFETFTDAANNSMLRFDACKTTAGVHRIMSEANGTGTKRPIAIDAYSKSGAPTSTELPSGTAGVFKDTGGGGVVIAYNDAGTIKTAALT